MYSVKQGFTYFASLFLIFDEIYRRGMGIAPTGGPRRRVLSSQKLGNPVSRIEISIGFSFKRIQRLRRVRFEIGQSGGFAILGGLVGLSAAVILLGLISDRELTQREQVQVASAYTMPTASPPQAAQPLSRSSVASENIVVATMPKGSHQIETRPQFVVATVSSDPQSTHAVEVLHDFSAPPDSSAPLGKQTPAQTSVWAEHRG
jgi:hypothetical protein